ncbi:hypothetical protein LSM04_002370 [Trypanosoma melophagium]|uniref:uncharacterized protein n=1 Tax=Trypanosoma melophagium TaxID=715481 RepID=UPI00351AAFBD|nr:hypothetical protein LSM04_002370 [Trypanosoma melophagium]
MSTQKRSRESGNCHDIRTIFKQERERAALLRSGPFFLERILSPKLVNPHYKAGGSLLCDPTRMNVGIISSSKQRSGVLALPQRTEASDRLYYYSQLQYRDFSTVVAPLSERTAVSSNIITDVVFDMEEEFAVVCQPRRLTVYTTEEWHNCHLMRMESVDSLPVVSVEARGWRSCGFGFSAVQFLASSLHIVAGYHHAPVVDIFDLEDVDEETCTPQQRFRLTEARGTGSSSTGSSNNDYNPPSSSSNNNNNNNSDGVMDVTSAYANDVVAVTEQVSLAALSSGHSVWLDRRSGKVETCTGVFAREYNIGQQNSSLSKRGPLTSVAFLCRNSPINIVCGTQTGVVQLWDVRYTRDCVAVHQTSAAVSCIQASYTPALNGVIWLNNHKGEVQGIHIGHDDMCLFAETKCADGVRSTATFHIPPPRLSLMESIGLLICPHISSNAFMFFDLYALMKQVLTPVNMEASMKDETIGVSGNNSKSRKSETNERDEKDGYGHASTRDFQSALTVMQQERFTKVIPKVSSIDTGIVHQIPYKNVLNCEGFPNISACGVWSKQSRVVMGNTEGRVQLA